MKFFNSFQMVLLFAATPFILTWVKDQNFYAHDFVFWSGCIIYVIAFWGMCASVYSILER